MSRLPQYNSIKAEVVQLLILSKQLAAPVTVRAQGKREPEIPNELCEKLKEVLNLDEWLSAHKNDCTSHLFSYGDTPLNTFSIPWDFCIRYSLSHSNFSVCNYFRKGVDEREG